METTVRRPFELDQGEGGNVLFLILLAVILFAALSYAVTTSSRSGSGDTASERASLRAGALLQYLTEMENAIVRMRLNGVQDNEINFYYQSAHNSVWGAFDNGNCTASRCRVFDPAGGGMPFLAKPVYKKSGGTTQVPRLQYVPLANVGSSASDVFLMMNAIDWDVCQEINRQMGISSMLYSQALPVNDVNSSPYEFGPFPVGDIPLTTAWGAPSAYTEKRTFCFSQFASKTASSGDIYDPVLIHVLMAR